MTYSSQELRDKGALPLVIRWKRWRRGMKLTQVEAAAMAGLYPDTIMDAERGATKPQKSTRAKLEALMARWPDGKQPKTGDPRQLS